MAIRFDDRTAIVTGAGSGLGRAHALMLASRGARVVVNDPGKSAGGEWLADAVVAEIVAAGGQAAANHESVASVEGAQRLVEQAVDAFGGLDILINNAGILRDRSFVKSDMADFDLVVAVHLLGSAYCTRAAWPIMQQAGYGRIVMTLSNTGLYGNFGQANYGAAKAGLIGLMNVLKIEGRKYGILVNALAPMAATAMTEATMSPEMLARFDPAFASAGMAVLASEGFAESGTILSAAAGHYAKVRIVSARGVQFTADAVSPEQVLDAWDRIGDLSDPVLFESAGDEVNYVAERTMKAAAAAD
ncbi:SDR family NAD(P)-dependent oxidoreductase [Sphingomonas sp. SFZ2018-12]|uniref:SDR family NAD(P)-dependent oxidoreductase n=1 Tax=Sphingomonas sp. SFZ2018-12 TaxID=2683197 RepID=UPI001F110333|nr:SDR family NAD(P)-dependent oxidoreductase [Sphingomonas sp. SFZ2018-12]